MRHAGLGTWKSASSSLGVKKQASITSGVPADMAGSQAQEQSADVQATGSAGLTGQGTDGAPFEAQDAGSANAEEAAAAEVIAASPPPPSPAAAPPPSPVASPPPPAPILASPPPPSRLLESPPPTTFPPPSPATAAQAQTQQQAATAGATQAASAGDGAATAAGTAAGGAAGPGVVSSATIQVVPNAKGELNKYFYRFKNVQLTRKALRFFYPKGVWGAGGEGRAADGGVHARRHRAHADRARQRRLGPSTCPAPIPPTPTYQGLSRRRSAGWTTSAATRRCRSCPPSWSSRARSPASSRACGVGARDVAATPSPHPSRSLPDRPTPDPASTHCMHARRAHVPARGLGLGVAGTTWTSSTSLPRSSSQSARAGSTSPPSSSKFDTRTLGPVGGVARHAGACHVARGSLPPSLRAGLTWALPRPAGVHGRGCCTVARPLTSTTCMLLRCLCVPVVINPAPGGLAHG